MFGALSQVTAPDIPALVNQQSRHTLKFKDSDNPMAEPGQ